MLTNIRVAFHYMDKDKFDNFALQLSTINTLLRQSITSEINTLGTTDLSSNSGGGELQLTDHHTLKRCLSLPGRLHISLSSSLSRSLLYFY